MTSIEDVPPEFTARNRVIGGFVAAIPIIGTALKVSENIKWINFVYYNQQQFMNYTITALDVLNERLNGLTESLVANNKMTLQLHLVVDWLAAKEGGMCAIVGED